MKFLPRNRWSIVAALGVAIVGAACAREDDSDNGVETGGSGDSGAPSGFTELRSAEPHDTAPAVADDDYASVIAGTTRFGLSLFHQVAPADDNFFFSPVSTALALGMTYAGARGATAQQMAMVLGSTVSPDVFASSMNRLLNDLAARNVAAHETIEGTKNLTLLPADAVWMQQGWDVAPDYLDVMSRRYDAGIKVLDLMGDPLGSTRTINRWVAANTKDKIVDLLPDGAISERTPLVLTNALYFYASWAAHFPMESTKDGVFHVRPDADVTVSTMHDVLRMPYGEGDGYQIIDLAYEGRKLSMTVLLPVAGRFAEVRDGLTETSFQAMRSTMTSSDVHLALPKFRFSWGTRSFKDQLIAMGMVDAFDAARADFSGLLPRGGLYIDDVMHKAFVGIDESGTEAAAATAVSTRDANAPTMPRDFTADRPFLIFVRDVTGALLFAGQVTNPAL